ncbi:DUF1801 domain-containing protein [Novosphingobium sp.]|uniref:DUF1801 domain-containing protein n=1 Tax=Novosphingobium sp. TaxID=1874826 RepID=UPI00286E2EA2|nr:DUF1801 domain-containing protein [Novosphingobium sp.]
MTATTDWRAATLDRVRAAILAADPAVVEEIKWRKPSNPAGVPTWSHGGLICTGETYKDKVKLTFARGAKLSDPAGLFGPAKDTGTRRAIDLKEGDTLDETAFTALIHDAIAHNAGRDYVPPEKPRK